MGGLAPELRRLQGNTVPLVALVLVFQQKIVSGLTAGAVKG